MPGSWGLAKHIRDDSDPPSDILRKFLWYEARKWIDPIFPDLPYPKRLICDFGEIMYKDDYLEMFGSFHNLALQTPKLELIFGHREP
jgi:hypothetical protein